MGGGDLNLKKSWHPNTMRNMEKVWKAEQRDNDEKRRIAELQREIIAERSREDMQRFAESSGVVEKKDNTKLDWMYKGPSGIVDREEYLLGRAVDKTFEHIEQSEQQGKALSSRKNAVERGDECLPNSIRFASDQQVDLARKMMEDPLLAIKKKEVENRQQLLSNPVKLKQLKQLIEMQNKKKKQKKEKKEKKDKKKKKKKKSSKNRDSDSDSDEDDRKLNALLAKKLNSLKNAGLLKCLADDDALDHKSKKHTKDRDDDGSESDHRDVPNSSKKYKDRDHDGGSELNHRDVRNFSNRQRQFDTKDHVYGGKQRYNSVRERSASPQRSNDRRMKNDYESRRYPDKSRNAFEGNQRYKREFGNDSRGIQKHRNFGSDERPVKREKDRRDFSPPKPAKSRRSRSMSLDRRKPNRDEVDRDKERKKRIPSPGDRIKARKRQDSESSLELDKRDTGTKSPTKLKKLSKKQESSDSEDSDSSSSAENDRLKKRLILMKREREADSDGERKMPTFGLMLPDGSKPVPKPVVKVKEEKRREEPEKPKWTRPERRKLDEKEVEARRREMMENSSWREKERDRNKRRHELELEEEKRQQAKKYDEDFARKQYAHAVSHSSVEGRIKSNINNIQRSKMAMDRNFARR